MPDTWFDEVLECAAVKSWIKRSAHAKAVTLPSGEFLFANEIWCRRLGYSWPELQQLTWRQITPVNTDLVADEANLAQLVAGDIAEYRLRKPYLAKGGYAVEGEIHVKRWPEEGEIKCCLVDWLPLQSGNNELMHYVTEILTGHTKTLNALVREMAEYRKDIQSAAWFGRLIDWLIDVVNKNPKKSAIVAGVCFVLFVGYTQGADEAAKWLKMFGWDVKGNE